MCLTSFSSIWLSFEFEFPSEMQRKYNLFSICGLAKQNHFVLPSNVHSTKISSQHKKVNVYLLGRIELEGYGHSHQWKLLITVIFLMLNVKFTFHSLYLFALYKIFAIICHKCSTNPEVMSCLSFLYFHFL